MKKYVYFNSQSFHQANEFGGIIKAVALNEKGKMRAEMG